MLYKLLSLNFIILLKQTFSCTYMQIKPFLCIYVKKNSKDLLSGYSEKLSGPRQVLKLGKYDLSNICSPSIHFVPLIRVGLGVSSLRREALTSLSPAFSSSISQGTPRYSQASHPSKKANFCLLYLWSQSFGHYPKLRTIGEGKDVASPVNQELCFYTQQHPHHCSHSINLSVYLPHPAFNNKTLSYLNSFTWDRNSSLTRSGHNILFQLRTMGDQLRAQHLSSHKYPEHFAADLMIQN